MLDERAFAETLGQPAFRARRCRRRRRQLGQLGVRQALGQLRQIEAHVVLRRHRFADEGVILLRELAVGQHHAVLEDGRTMPIFGALLLELRELAIEEVLLYEALLDSIAQAGEAAARRVGCCWGSA